jgi:RNA polymerase sigma-70 factor, ECF subfamily
MGWPFRMIFSSVFAALHHSSDSALAGRAARGDRAAQREVFHALKGTVHATLYRVLGSNEHMEDLLQDVFIEVFRSLPNYRGESKLSTWASSIAARVAFHYLRSKRARTDRNAEAPVQLHLVGSPEDHAQHREGLQHLYGLLRRMTPEQHIALALFMVDGRSIEEIAELTGVTAVAVKNRVFRARRKLWAAARKDPALTAYLADREAAEQGELA